MRSAPRWVQAQLVEADMQLMFRLDQGHDIALPQAVVDRFGPFFQPQLQTLPTDFDSPQGLFRMSPILVVLIFVLQLVEDCLSNGAGQAARRQTVAARVRQPPTSAPPPVRLPGRRPTVGLGGTADADHARLALGIHFPAGPPKGRLGPPCGVASSGWKTHGQTTAVGRSRPDRFYRA